MSVNIELQFAPPGEPGSVGEAWTLKERIRKSEGVLKQRRTFFENAYRRAGAYELFDGDRLVGFAATRRDGYLLFLAVDPEYRDRGFGRKLVEAVVTDHDTVTCHARTTNREALAFYAALDFEVVRRIDNYYEDNGSAYYLKRGDGGSLTDRLSEILQR